jgi:hypothetical protein
MGEVKPKPWTFLVVAVAGWVHQKQLDVIDTVREENRVLREQFGRQRLRLTDLQRPRPAARARAPRLAATGERASEGPEAAGGGEGGVPPSDSSVIRTFHHGICKWRPGCSRPRARERGGRCRT